MKLVRENKCLQKLMSLRLKAIFIIFNPIQDGPFWWCSQMGVKKDPFPEICHTYPAMIKLGTITPYLNKIQKIYESQNTHPEFC